MSKNLIKVGVFFDGSYFTHVNRYYVNYSDYKSLIGFEGLHDFIIRWISENEGVGDGYVRIIDSLYFRGRHSAKESKEKNNLYKDRLFDEMMLNSGIKTMYFHLADSNGSKKEKGVDVALALEVYDLNSIKSYDYVVLIAGDKDFCPLVHKLHSKGTKTILLAWDIEYVDENNVERFTKTSNDLYNAVCFPLQMAELIDEMDKEDQDDLFQERA